MQNFIFPGWLLVCQVNISEMFAGVFGDSFDRIICFYILLFQKQNKNKSERKEKLEFGIWNFGSAKNSKNQNE